MSFRFDPDTSGLHYAETGSTTGVRSAFVVAGLLALAASCVFVWLAWRGWQHGPLQTAAQVGGLVASCVSWLVFVAFGVFCLKTGLFTPVQSALFDGRQRELHYTARSPGGGVKHSRWAFDAIGDVAPITHASSDGDHSYALGVQVGPRRIELGSTTDRAQAEAWLQQVMSVLQR